MTEGERARAVVRELAERVVVVRFVSLAIEICRNMNTNEETERKIKNTGISAD